MTFDCKFYCHYCVVCKRAKSDPRGGVALTPLGVSEYPWEIVGLDYYVTALPQKWFLWLHTFFYGLSPN